MENVIPSRHSLVIHACSLSHGQRSTAGDRQQLENCLDLVESANPHKDPNCNDTHCAFIISAFHPAIPERQAFLHFHHFTISLSYRSPCSLLELVP